MKHQAIDRVPALTAKKGRNKKTIDLHGRVTRRDLFSIMRAMDVGDSLYITHDQTGRNAWSVAWSADMYCLKRFEFEEYPGCYSTVECKS